MSLTVPVPSGMVHFGKLPRLILPIPANSGCSHFEVRTNNRNEYQIGLQPLGTFSSVWKDESLEDHQMNG